MLSPIQTLTQKRSTCIFAFDPTSDMSVSALCHQNAQNARAVGVNAFKRFLDAENVSLDYVFDCMSNDPNGKCLGAVMDKFALHLAFNAGVKEKMLSTNTAMSYFRHVKNWLLEIYPSCHAAIEERLREMGRILEKYMMKREAGGVTKHASACTKKDLSLLVRYLYVNATCPTDYQDAALVGTLWYVFGRASDFSLVQKESVSVCSNRNFFIRLVRVKTTEQQGLTLYPDKDITMCPILAIAVALAMQAAPCPQLLEHVRSAPDKLDLEALESLPLMELLLQAEQQEPATLKPEVKTKTKKTSAPPGIHNQVNRLLSRVASPAGVQATLSSHSFRRGGAEHANGKAGMSMQWIADRGGWNLFSSHKVYAYVFNTTQEDQRVSKVLSGWGSMTHVPLDGLEALDAEVSVRVRAFQSLLFNTCTGLGDARLNVCAEVLDVSTARLLRALPMLRMLQPSGSIIARVDLCATEAGIRRDELLCMAMALEETNKQDKERSDSKPATEHCATDHQTALIRELLEANRLLVNRLEALEAKADGKVAPRDNPVNNPNVKAPPQITRKKTPASHLSSVWYDWYAGEPRLSSNVSDRKKRSEGRHVVAYMKLFFASAFTLDEAAVTYRDDVMRLGVQAECAVVRLLAEQGIKSTGSSAVLKHMRALHKRGKLNGHIREYKARLVMGVFVDSAPRETRDVLEIVTPK